MREWKIKDAQWKVCDWTISICLAQRDKALQTISHEALITYYILQPEIDLCVSLCSHANIRSTCHLNYRKLLVRALLVLSLSKHVGTQVPSHNKIRIWILLWLPQS